MLHTENKDWGFYGTACRQCGEEFAQSAWKAAFEHITNVMGWDEEMTLLFLDSPRGRHYADDLEGQEHRLDRLTRYACLEEECRAFFKEINPAGYRVWCKVHGCNPTEKVPDDNGVVSGALAAAVRNLTGLDYSASRIEHAIHTAGPLAQALALLLAKIPEEMRSPYIGRDC